ncbi:MAG: MarR family winged helix-turn-helix transcriptional regulator [Clostridium sp.]|uniref:MarR family winged helix-turn-helix transcriptional regulator n=1 Tax=Clostridium sp. TaxID=1506 RepID=UPI003EE4EF4D
MFNVEEGLGLLINVSDKLMINSFNRKIKKEGINITFEQFTILTMLWDNENICQLTLAKLTNRDEASTSRLISTLIKNELIIKETSSVDKRVKNIKLTSKGEEIEGIVKKVIKECFKEATFGLEEEEIEIGMKLLNKIRVNMS